MEGGSTGNSRRKSYTTKFKLEVIVVAKEIGNREAGRLFNFGESNKPFRDQLRAKWEKLMMVGIHEYNKMADEETVIQRYSGMDCRKLGCCK
jgi:hypothetical protein